MLHIKQEQSSPYKKIKQALLKMLKIGKFCEVKVVANIGIYKKIKTFLLRNKCTVTTKKVKKYSPVTNCRKVPITLCAPAGCGFKAVIVTFFNYLG